MNPWDLTRTALVTSLALWRLQGEVARVAAGAPVVVALRFGMAARKATAPDFLLDPEWQRMVQEKATAAFEAQRHLWLYSLRAYGKPFEAAQALAAASRSVGPYRRRVGANVRRLAR